MDSYNEINVKDQESDDKSVLNFYRKLLKLRQEHKDVFVYGSFELLDEANESTMTFLKRSSKDPSKVAVVTLNFTDKEQPFALPVEAGDASVSLVIENVDKPRPHALAPFEARVYLSC